MTPVRMAQWGTGHGHAEGKLCALRSNPGVELVGVIEPDRARRAALERDGSAYAGVRWFDDPSPVLDDPAVVAVAAEGRNDESLAEAAAIIRAGKHLWLDKPAGDDLPAWLAVADEAERRGLLIQLGYMFRYHHGFMAIAELARSGALGEVFSVRAHMSTSIPLAARAVIARHRGGIFYDLAGHMIDQIVGLLGRPLDVTLYARQDADAVSGFADNTLGVLAFDRAMAIIDIAAMEPAPTARRFEVYGRSGSAIMEPFEPAGPIRLCLATGVQTIPVPTQTRQELYDRELDAFLATLSGRPPDRTLAHERLVQETLLRLTTEQGLEKPHW